MLTKLLKYEFKSTARVFGACYLGLAALSILCGLSLKLDASLDSTASLIFTMAYTCMLFAVMLVTFITILQRFYKNLLGGEGYLMNTLPVRSWHLVASKLIAALVWCFASLVMVMVSVVLLLLVNDWQTWRDFLWALPRVPEAFVKLFNSSFVSFLVQTTLVSLVEGVNVICLLYVSCMIGHQFRRMRTSASIVAFFVITFVVDALGDSIAALLPFQYGASSWFSMLFGYTSVTLAGDVYSAFSSGLWFWIIFDGLLAALYFAATSYMLERRLNLE